MFFRRPRLLPLFALSALVAVGLLAGCGKKKETSENPTALLKKAFAANVESGELKVKFGVDAQGSGKMSGPVSVTLDGPFKSRGKDKLPLLDWNISASGAGQSLSGGVVATEDNAYVKFRGQTYEVGTELYKQFVRQQERNQQSGPQDLSDLGIDPSKWLEDGKVSDGKPIGGADTRVVTGKINVERMVDDILAAAKSPQVRKQLEGSGQTVPEVSKADKQKVVDAVEDAKLTVNVDEKDIARRVAVAAKFKSPKGANADGVTGGKVNFVYELPKVGGEVDITAPTNAKPLSLLLQQLGLGSGLPGGGLRTQ